MKSHILIMAIVLVLVRARDLNISPWYQAFRGYISSHSLLLNSTGIFLILLLIFLAVFVNSSAQLSAIRAVNILLREASLFVLNLVALGSLYCALWLDKNIWPDFQPIIALPVIGVLASALCVNIIDFNQPLKPGIVSSMLVAGASFCLVNLILI